VPPWGTLVAPTKQPAVRIEQLPPARMQRDSFDDSKENVAADPIEPPWTSTPR